MNGSTIMIRTIAIAALVVASMTTANAQLGQTIHINGRGSLPGCTNLDDAKKVHGYTGEYGPRGEDLALEAVKLMNRQNNPNPFDFSTKRWCTMLNTRPDEEWKIIEIRRDRPSTGPRFAWYCLESTIDFSSADKPADRPNPWCFWVRMLAPIP